EEEEEEEEEDSELTSRAEQRNWAELPRDVLSVIFKKIGAVEILRSAQFVCRPWRQLSLEPELWRHIVVAMPDERMDPTHLESLVMLAADRSEGSLEKFHLEGFASVKDEIFGYIAD
ncbi:putative F-box/LRR-repeat protein 9, partial [Phalaenopsis equestris]|uniref:putative F-box/LRR-repeat protein 9 n=1 Tax=Phalaenopsis equestris TaxID=78828 RepID=UPI0009E2E8EB